MLEGKGLYAALAVIFAVGAGGLAMYLRGLLRGVATGRANEKAREAIREIREAVERGDDAEIQRLLMGKANDRKD